MIEVNRRLDCVSKSKVGFLGEEVAKSIHELRVKSGRVLSDTNRKRLATLLTSLQTCAVDIDGLLKDTEPQPKSIDPDLARGLVANFELFRMRHRIGENHALRD